MPSGKVKQYCNIPVYLENKKGGGRGRFGGGVSLYGGASQLCALSHLIPKGSNFGVTLMYPVDKDSLKQAADIDGVGESVAHDNFMRLIIPMALTTVSMWGKYKDDIPNKLGEKIEVKSISRGRVELGNGSYLTKSKDFVATDDKRNVISVWDLHGPIPSGSKKASMKYVGQKLETTGGRYLGGDASSVEPRARCINDIERQIQNFAKDIKVDVISERVVSFMAWMCKKNPSEYFKVGGYFECLTGMPHVDYFVCLGMADPDNLGTFNHLETWLSETNGEYESKSGMVLQDYINLYDRQAEKYYEIDGGARFNALEKVKRTRAKVLEDVSKTGLRRAVLAAYGGDIKKAWCDEMRMLASDLYSEYMEYENKAMGFRNFARDMIEIYKKPSRMNSLMYMGDVQSGMSSPILHISTLLRFARSNAFLWMPIRKSDINDSSYGSSDYSPVGDTSGSVGVSVSPFNWYASVRNEVKQAASFLLAPHRADVRRPVV